MAHKIIRTLAYILILWILAGIFWYAHGAANVVPGNAPSMTLRDEISSLIIFHVPGTDPLKIVSFVNTYHPGGIIFMSDNVPKTLEEMTAASKIIQTAAPRGYPLFLALDEEGCTVKRLASDALPCAHELGTLPLSATTDAFRARAELLRSVGVNLNFGIVADVTSDKQSFIYPRVFGGDAQEVAKRVRAALEGEHGIVLSTLKHFPGHGETPEDSHAVIPSSAVSASDWTQRDAPPFAEGAPARADFIMIGQLKYSSVDDAPATLSKKWHEKLSNEIGFRGIVITDDMVMLQESGDPRYSNTVENAVAALRAGNTMLLYVNDHQIPESEIDVSALLDGLAAAVESGEVPRTLIDADARQALSVRATLAQ